MLVLACLLAPAATAAQAAEVKVHLPTGNTVAVQLDSLLANPDVRDRPYTIRGAGGTTMTEPLTGVSLAAVLKSAKAGDFKLAEVQDAAGNIVEVEGPDAVKADWAPQGPPIFTVDAEGVRFLRDSTSEADLNEADQLRAGFGLTIVLKDKSEPRVSATASPSRPDVGEKVTLTAEVGGVPSGAKTKVSWLIDGTSRSGEVVEHTFRKKGTVRVLVTLVLPDGTNRSDVVVVKVGAAEEKKPRTEKDPKDEPGTVTSGSTGGSGAGTGGSGSGVDSGSGSGSGTASPAPSASDAAPTPAPAASAPQAAEPEKPKRRREARKPAAPKPETIPGEVTGELLVADTAPPAEPPRRSVASAPEAEATGTSSALGLPPAAWTGIGVGVALVAGFALDRRRLRIV